MGNLHQGHLNLLTTARERTDFVVSSIFVNPLQFNVKDDLERYPRTLQEDQQSLIEYGCDLLFANPIDQQGVGFAASANQGWLLSQGASPEAMGPCSKLALAHGLLDRLRLLMPQAASAD